MWSWKKPKQEADLLIINGLIDSLLSMPYFNIYLQEYGCFHGCGDWQHQPCNRKTRGQQKPRTQPQQPLGHVHWHRASSAIQTSLPTSLLPRSGRGWSRKLLPFSLHLGWQETPQCHKLFYRQLSSWWPANVFDLCSTDCVLCLWQSWLGFWKISLPLGPFAAMRHSFCLSVFTHCHCSGPLHCCR